MKKVVQIVFVSGTQLLLSYRQNTEAFDQYWGFPSGRVEHGELPQCAAEREALEEVSVNTTTLKLIAELVDPDLPVYHYFYLCPDWVGELVNAEPKLCRELRWYDINGLPTNCTPVTYLAIDGIKRVLCDKHPRI